MRTIRVISSQYNQPPSVDLLNFVLSVEGLVDSPSDIKVCFLDVKNIFLHDTIYAGCANEVLFQSFAFSKKICEVMPGDDMGRIMSKEHDERAEIRSNA